MAVITAQVNKGKGKEVEEKGGNASIAACMKCCFLSDHLLLNNSGTSMLIVDYVILYYSIYIIKGDMFICLSVCLLPMAGRTAGPIKTKLKSKGVCRLTSNLI